MAEPLISAKELAEQFAKALHGALEQHTDRLRHPVLFVETGAAVDEHHLHPSSAIQSLT